MLTLYLAALIFGLGTSLLQLAFSSDAGGSDAASPEGLGADAPALGGAELTHALPAEALSVGAAEPALEVHAAAAAQGDSAPHGLAGHNLAGTALEWASMFLSLRFYMFAAIGFGSVGAPATWLGASSPGLTLAVSLAVGLGVATLISHAFRRLAQHSTNSSTEPGELVGRVGRVLLPCEKGRPGKVRLEIRGQIVDYLATTDEAHLGPGALVMVEEVRPLGIHVCAAPSELLPR